MHQKSFYWFGPRWNWTVIKAIIYIVIIFICIYCRFVTISKKHFHYNGDKIIILLGALRMIKLMCNLISCIFQGSAYSRVVLMKKRGNLWRKFCIKSFAQKFPLFVQYSTKLSLNQQRCLVRLLFKRCFFHRWTL